MADSNNYKSFDPATFKKTVHVAALRVPVKQIKTFMQKWRKLLWNQPKMKNVYPDPSGTKNFKAIALNDKINIEDDLKTWIAENQIEQVQISVEFSFEQYSAQEILKQLLPDGVESPKGYEQAGHIIHFNLREEHLPHKKLIGDVFLRKTKGVRTVINKTSSIANEFRVFPHEILAGENDMIVTMKENGCNFKFDYGKVYWNSKLGTEHQRVVDAIESDSVVFDLCAGVGPFVVPLAKKNCKVFANDLNPVSFKFLKENVQINKCNGVHFLNMDARDAFREWISQGHRPSHIVLNLPGLALTFLDMLIEAYPSEEDKMPVVHCYYFAPDVNGADYLRDELKKILKGYSHPDVQYRQVRNVAPHKDMYCVEFRLDARLGCKPKRKISEPNDSDSKRQKVAEDD